MRRAIIYYSNNLIAAELMKSVQDTIAVTSLEIISVTQQPIDFGKNIVVGKQPREPRSIFYQMLIACENTDADIVYMAEHDVLYGIGHFDFMPPDMSKTAYYDTNIYIKDSNGYYRRQGNPLSMCVCPRIPLIENLRLRLDKIKHGEIIPKAEIAVHSWETGWIKKEYSCDNPSIDVRHNQNFCRVKTKPKGVEYLKTI